MRFSSPIIGRWAALLASLLIVGSAAAADVPPADSALAMRFPTMHASDRQPFASPELATDVAAAPAPLVAGMGQPIGAESLDGLRGGDDVKNTVSLDGSVTGNTADRIVSGANTIQEGAFANANGISTVIQNSGSNVLIQNGMVVNVQFVAPGL